VQAFQLQHMILPLQIFHRQRQVAGKGPERGVAGLIVKKADF
jgi:hypothetical protein